MRPRCYRSSSSGKTSEAEVYAAIVVIVPGFAGLTSYEPTFRLRFALGLRNGTIACLIKSVGDSALE